MEQLKRELILKEEQKKEDNLRRLRKEFLQLDFDGDGQITTKDLGVVLRSMRTKLRATEGQNKRVLDDIDKDGDGTIEMKEYLKYMKNQTNKNLIFRALYYRSNIRREFLRYDVDGSGYITKDEFMHVIKVTMGGALSEHQFDTLFTESDYNSDGKINYEEFVILMTR